MRPNLLVSIDGTPTPLSGTLPNPTENTSAASSVLTSVHLVVRESKSNGSTASFSTSSSSLSVSFCAGFFAITLESIESILLSSQLPSANTHIRYRVLDDNFPSFVERELPGRNLPRI